MAGKKQNIGPMWSVLLKQVDLGEPTSSLDHVYLGCTQRECETSEDIVDNHRTMFESRISAGATENYQSWKNSTIPRGPTIWKVMQRNAWSGKYALNQVQESNRATFKLCLITVSGSHLSGKTSQCPSEHRGWRCTCKHRPLSK